MNAPRRYVNIGSDSARWEQFEHRSGDIIISTPPKSGTTLTQRICALAVFQTGELAESLDEISPWFDHNVRSDEHMRSIVEAQQHRRFLKTHTPLDGIPSWDDVIYINTARDPRDIFASWEGQIGNLDPERTREAINTGVGLDKVQEFLKPPPATLAERVQQWLEAEDLNKFSLARHLHQMELAWKRQSQPNVFLFHFEQLRSDRKAALRAVAAALDIELTAQQVDDLAPFTSFEAMKADAANLAPNTKGIFAEPAKFFRSGTSGGWQELLSAEQLDRYDERTKELASPEFLAWLEAPSS